MPEPLAGRSEPGVVRRQTSLSANRPVCLRDQSKTGGRFGYLSGSSKQEPAQNPQIDRIHLLAVGPFLRRLQDHGPGPEAWVVEQKAKGLESEVPLADVGMPVHPAALGF